MQDVICSVKKCQILLSLNLAKLSMCGRLPYEKQMKVSVRVLYEYPPHVTKEEEWQGQGQHQQQTCRITNLTFKKRRLKGNNDNYKSQIYLNKVKNCRTSNNIYSVLRTVCMRWLKIPAGMKVYPRKTASVYCANKKLKT